MLKDPPRDSNGRVTPHDHAQILREHFVIRHTTPHDLHRTETGEVRLASGAFSESQDGGMSVDLENAMADRGLSPLHFVKDETHGAVRLNVGELRDLGFQVGYDPDGGHDLHGAVWGIGNGSTRRKKILRVAITVRMVAGQTIPNPPV